MSRALTFQSSRRQLLDQAIRGRPENDANPEERAGVFR